MEINIIHYHLFTGGVTSVIQNALTALREHHSQLRVNIWCGARMHIEKFITHMKQNGFAIEDDADTDSSDTHAYSIRVTVNKDVFYHNDITAVTHRARKKRILKTMGASTCPVWWIHNYHLGKNCALTDAILTYIERHPNKTFLLHIHDFPEQGRGENYTRLRKRIVTSLYPHTHGTHYIVINSSDYQIMQNAGMNDKQLHCIPNPTFTSTKQKLTDRYTISQQRRKLIRDCLAQKSIQKYAVGQPIPHTTKILIYPVRTIKRKNILEAMLISAGLNQMHTELRNSMQPELYSALIVTLPANSRQHQHYARIVRKLFANQTAKGLWGIGLKLDALKMTYRELICASDAIISTSVQEGFGFTMFEALMAKQAFISRSIPSLDMSTPYFHAHQLQKYQEIKCSWELSMLKSQKHRLKHAYQLKIAHMAKLYSSETSQKLIAQAENLFQRAYFEFSYLPPRIQCAILNSPAAIAKIVDSNKTLFHDMYNAITHSFPAPNYQLLINDYGNNSFARSINSILEQNPIRDNSPISSTTQSNNIDAIIANAHAKIDYARVAL